MENKADDLLDQLYALSGNSNRTPGGDQYFLVSSSLHHPSEDVRERAVFIGGLRWMDKAILGYFKDALISGEEVSDNIRRLMIECLVSEAIERSGSRDSLAGFLADIQRSSGSQSLAGKAAFVGIKRLKGEISKNEFAVLDYDDIHVNDD
ncbi:hypothetical protein JR065_02665 [Xanthomonas sp. AmX2]|uniref:hypothetical protein n=1 Tax=Xanthomonas sp. TaxID=29446 RepID=UPI00197D9E18|nr:hypothetical protein [Xanthomonas sp.]MBN6149232.1 hypothetical protein [Xanthomonas sp.]